MMNEKEMNMIMTLDEVRASVEESVVDCFGSMEEFVMALAKAGAVEIVEES